MSDKIMAYRCPMCASTEVGWDASSVFDPVTQTEELGSSYDSGWCNDCGEVKPDEYEITDQAEIEHIMAERRLIRARDNAEQMLEVLRQVVEYADTKTVHSNLILALNDLGRAAKPILAKIEGSQDA